MVYENMKSHDEIIESITRELPRLASDLIRKYQDMSYPANQAFAANPDDPAQHETHWHDFGIITHSKKFLEALQTVVPKYLAEWGLKDRADKVLDEKIDGLAKWQLLQITAMVHDIGKFTARTPHGFRDHEMHSGKLLRNDLYDFLVRQGLTPRQIEYVATCAERHFELGKVRRKFRRRYTRELVESDDFKATVRDIVASYPEVALEIGLIFIADSLGKTAKPNAQLPINIAAARSYLQTWAEMTPL